MSKEKPVSPAEQPVQPSARDQLTFKQVTVTHSGPLPDPATLKEYSNLLPDAVDRIFSMAERDQSFIHGYQLREQKYRHRHLLVGQIFGFLLGLSAVIGAVVLALNDKPMTGATVFLGAVVTLIGTAVWAHRTGKPTDK